MLNPSRLDRPPVRVRAGFPGEPTHAPGPGSKTSPLGAEKIGRLRGEVIRERSVKGTTKSEIPPHIIASER